MGRTDLAYCLAAGLVVTRVAGFHDGGLRFQHRRPERPTFLALGAARSARASVGYPVVRLHATAEEEEEGEGEGAQEGGESRDVDPSSSSRESTSFSSSLAAAAAFACNRGGSSSVLIWSLRCSLQAQKLDLWLNKILQRTN